MAVRDIKSFDNESILLSSSLVEIYLHMVQLCKEGIVEEYEEDGGRYYTLKQD